MMMMKMYTSKLKSSQKQKLILSPMVTTVKKSKLITISNTMKILKNRAKNK